MRTVTFLLALVLAGLPAMASAGLAFPGAVGPAAETPGGRGGRILRVTTLAPSGPGSFRAAIESTGPRIIVFEVGGVIDLARTTIDIRHPFLTIAGQTAPSPGITLVRGGIDIRTHDVVVRHIRVRPGDDGEPRRSGWEPDAISTIGARNVIVDHCSLMWAPDENLSASGPRFTGSTPEEWRAGASRTVTFSYNLLAEGLAKSTHPKGEHSKGSLIHDNATGIVIWRNIYAHNVERNPLLKGGVHATVANNLIYNARQRAVHYNLMALEWAGQRYQNGRLNLVGNVLRGGPDTVRGMPLFALGGDGDIDLHMAGNIAVDWHGQALPLTGRYGETRARIIDARQPLDMPAGLSLLDARDVETHLLARAGARPWDRDAHDLRVLFDIAEGRGAIIDSEREVGGFRAVEETRAPFVEAEWNLDTMEPKSGRYPGQTGPIQEPLSERDRAMRRD